MDEPEIQLFLREVPEEPEIEEHADGRYWKFLRSGFSFSFGKDSRLRTIHIFPEGRDGFGGFAEPLPGGFSWRSRKDDVVQQLGPPSKSGGGGKSILYARVPDWIRYDYPDYSLHTEFSGPDDAVGLLTLMSPNAVPR